MTHTAAAPKLTEAQRRILRALVDGQIYFGGVERRSIRVLEAAGLAERYTPKGSGYSGFKPTDAGLALDPPDAGSRWA